MPLPMLPILNVFAFSKLSLRSSLAMALKPTPISALSRIIQHYYRQHEQQQRLRQLSDEDLLYTALLWKSKHCIPELRRRKLPVPAYVLEQ